MGLKVFLYIIIMTIEIIILLTLLLLTSVSNFNLYNVYDKTYKMYTKKEFSSVKWVPVFRPGHGIGPSHRDFESDVILVI